MVTRCILIGVVLIACGRSEGTKQGAAATGSNAPQDKPVALSNQSEVDELERAIAPYSEQARRSYPDAKQRYLAGLPSGHRFAVATKLHSPGRVETVFVAVQRIEGDRITGTIASDVRGVTGYKTGDSYTLPESDVVDWVISHPDGSEEGNVVGKFLDTWSSQKHPGSAAQPSAPAGGQGSGQP